MKILHVCAYAASYEGNFIKSLYALESKMNGIGYETIYAFPEMAKNKGWCRELANRANVYFLPMAKARIKLQTYLKLRNIYKKNSDLTIIHTHFELYDIPVVITSPKHVKIFWHLHDAISNNGIKSVIFNKLQYYVLSKNVRLLSVCDFYKDFVVELGFPEEHAVTILNGIDLERVKPLVSRKVDCYKFLTFGWDYYAKGIDLILHACKSLSERNNNFSLILVCNEVMWNSEIFKKYRRFQWLIKQDFTEDINMLFEKANCFISASRRETFSYAVAEAAYAGLPVISSDIPGLEWAKDIPTILHFQSENLNSLYKIMEKMVLGNSSLDDVKMIEAREIIKQKYSVEIWTDRIVQQYQNCLLLHPNSN